MILVGQLPRKKAKDCKRSSTPKAMTRNPAPVAPIPLKMLGTCAVYKGTKKSKKESNNMFDLKPPREVSHLEQFEESNQVLDGWRNSEDPTKLSGPLKLSNDGGSGYTPSPNPIA
jgi:hypothetical protein